MGAKKQRQDLPPDLRVFLTEVGEAVKEYLETKHRESRKMEALSKGGEENDESSRLFSSK